MPYKALIAALGVLAVCPDAHAIMRRHDVPDADYLVQAEAYPQIVDLLSPGDCLGTLVTPDWLITAAHCAAHLSDGHTIAIDGADYEVEGVVCHPSYDGDEHDIAMVKLTEPVVDLPPLSLYRDDDEHGQRVLFVGRGDHGTGVRGQRKATNDGRTRAATNTVYKATRPWLEFVFNEPGDGALTPREGISGDGDSGGPALIETDDGLAIAGVSSWQDAPRRKIGKYGVHDFYARVSTDLEFIDEVTGDDWDGLFRDCPPESGCSVAGTHDQSPAPWLLLGLVALGWRRRALTASV